MALYKKVKNIKGIMKISVEGFFIERFINLCLQEDIEIWDIERKNEGVIYVKFFYNKYEKICEIANITRCKIVVLEKNGAPFFINKYKHRKIFAALIAIVATIITVGNMFIWNIEIVGEFSIPIEEIKQLLVEENIKVGVLKRNVNTDEAKLNIVLKRNDISWIGINIKGNKVVVEVVPKELVEEDIFKDSVGNIISDKSGIVEKIYVAEGTAMVKKGQLIEKGTLLISGIVINGVNTKAGMLGDPSVMKETRKVKAEGDVTLKTTYVEKTKIPLEKDIVSRTGNVEKIYKLKINNYTINLINKVTNFEKYDTITAEKVFSLFGQFNTPISLVEESFEEIEVDRIKYTQKQAEELGIVTNNEKLKKIIPADAEKINYYNNVREDEEYLEVETIVQCFEKAGTYEKIEGNVN
ncbi:MAG: sporulation protein YqfD [Clostridia bacterium]|nr:sporulation protein YqfD [Clostridia bacterium]